MLQRKKSLLSGIFALLPLIACQNTETVSPSDSQVSTVSIPQTDVRDQGRFGICWAYGTTALIESELLKNRNIAIDLSEEAIAFEHMAEALRAQFATMSSMDLVDFLMRGQLPEGWVTRTTPELAAMYEDSPYVQHDALALIKIHGAVPESAWSFKIKTLEQKAQLLRAVRENVRKAMAAGYIIQKLTIDQIKDLILVGPEKTAFPSRPPTSFKWQGKNIRAEEFVKSILAFNPDAWEAIALSTEADFPRFIQLIKTTLSKGHSVPLAFPINIDRISGDVFRADQKSKNYIWSNYGRDGGHLVLVTDFINIGGQRGAVSDATLMNELNKPAEELDALLFKNSWGIGAKLNENGQPVGLSIDGYYRMEAGYIKGIARIPEVTKNKWSTSLAVIPRAIVESQLVTGRGSTPLPSPR
jgi:hypothetical protein